jgi:hypothetical protein
VGVGVHQASIDRWRCANFVAEHLATLGNLPPAALHETIATEPKRDLNRAADRGTDVHTIMATLLAGAGVIPGLVPNAAEYLDICHQLAAELGATPLFVETVAISRRYGIGGTFDICARLGNGDVALIDWKSRSVDSNHGAYPEEACQVGFYGTADYWIIDCDGVPTRIAVPHIDYGLVVSIKPDSYELYPIDLEVAAAGLVEMRECWERKSAGMSHARRAIGKPKRLATVDATAGPLPAALPVTAGAVSSADVVAAAAPAPATPPVDDEDDW